MTSDLLFQTVQTNKLQRNENPANVGYVIKLLFDTTIIIGK